MNKEPKKLVEEHWNSYVEPLLIAHGEDPEVIKKCKFHYISSGVHFYKHARNDITEEISNNDQI